MPDCANSSARSAPRETAKSSKALGYPAAIVGSATLKRSCCPLSPTVMFLAQAVNALLRAHAYLGFQGWSNAYDDSLCAARKRVVRQDGGGSDSAGAYWRRQRW